MHTPVGTALLLQRMSGGDSVYFGMMLLANMIAVWFNPLTLFGQEDRARMSEVPAATTSSSAAAVRAKPREAKPRALV